MAPNRWPEGPLPTETPYWNLPIADSHCMNESCLAFAAGWNQSYKDTSLICQVNYGFWVLCYYLCWGFLFILAYLILLSRERFTRYPVEKPASHVNWKHILVARYRSVAYRRFSGRLRRLELPSFAILALFSSSTIFCAALIFPEQPYLRSRFRFGSPPLSVRCALCITALMPLLIALGGKVNLVTLLTGVCYTKLNVFHRYVGGLIFAFATIHTIPHIYAPIKDGGLNYLAQLCIDQKRELSGTILYFLFLIMIFLSVPLVRRRFYELFVYTHIFLALTFIGLLGWHIKGEYISPNYMYVAVGILCVQSFLRVCTTKSLLSGFPTTIERLPGNVVKVTIEVPPHMRWQPGHHAFLRMPSLSLLDNHPFTIASIPTPTPAAGSRQPTQNPNVLLFLIRARDGFTRHLSLRTDSDAVRSQPSAAAAAAAATAIATAAATATTRPLTHRIYTLVDGPHGGHAPCLHRTADAVVLVAAGTGITAALPWVLHLAAAMQQGDDDERQSQRVRVRDVRLVWIVRSAECVGWARRELESAVARAGRERMVVNVYVTGGSGRSVAKRVDGERKEACVDLGGLPTPPASFRSDSSSTFGGDDVGSADGREEECLEDEGGLIDVHYERPVLAELVPTLLSGKRAYVMGCGPDGMKVELANKVAELQLEMVVRAKRMESITLHTEDFGW